VGDYTDTAQKFEASMGYPKADAIQSELKVKSFKPTEAVELVKRLRERSSNALNAANVNLDNAELGAAYRRAADAIEDVISKNLEKRGNPEMYKQFTENRVYIAKAYDALGALDKATGSFNAQAFGKMYEKGVPFTGKMADMSRVASAFKDYFQPVKKAAGGTAGSRSITQPTLFGTASEIVGAQPLARKLLLNPDLPWKGVGGEIPSQPTGITGGGLK
jgi:hypothetical protein